MNKNRIILIVAFLCLSLIYNENFGSTISRESIDARKAETGAWWNTNWEYRIPLDIPPSDFTIENRPVHAHLDLDKFVEQNKLPGVLDRSSLRIIYKGKEELPFTIHKDHYKQETHYSDLYLAWVIPGRVEAGQQESVELYFNTIQEDLKQEAPQYKVLPGENLLKYGSFITGGQEIPGVWGIKPGYRKFFGAGTYKNKEALKVEVNKGNAEYLEMQNHPYIAQRVNVGKLKNIQFNLGCTFFLEKGDYGVPVSIQVLDVDEKDKYLRVLAERHITLTPGKEVKVKMEGRFLPATREVEVRFIPRLVLEEAGWGRRKPVHGPESYCRLYASDFVMSPGADIPFPSRLDNGFVQGRLAMSKKNLGLDISGKATFIFPVPAGTGWSAIGKPYHFEPKQGTIEAWVKPSWDSDDGREHTFFRVNPKWHLDKFAKPPKRWIPERKRIRFLAVKRGDEQGNEFEFLIRDRDMKVHSIKASLPFKKDTWANIALTWDFAKGQMSLFFNGEKVGQIKEGRPWKLDCVMELLEFGNRNGIIHGEEDFSRYCFDGVFDEIRISDIIRYGSGYVPESQKPFVVDKNTRALFHFDGSLEGTHFGGDRLIRVMAPWTREKTEESVVLETLGKEGHVESREIIIPQEDSLQVSIRKEANKCRPFNNYKDFFEQLPGPASLLYKRGSIEKTLRDSPSTLSFDVEGDYSPLMRKIEIEVPADETETATDIKLLCNNLDVTSIESIAKSVTRGLKTGREKAVALFRWAAENNFWWAGVEEKGIGLINDPVKRFNMYKLGVCSSIAASLADLWMAAGFPSRTVDITHHVVPEVYYGGKWHLLDPSVGMYGIGRDGIDIPSAREIAKDHQLVEWAGDNKGYTSFGRDDVRDYALHYIHYIKDLDWQRSRRKFHDMKLDLRPGEKIQYTWHNEGHPHPEVRDGHIMYEFVNGRVVYTPLKSEKSWRKNAIIAQGVDMGARGRLEISKKGGKLAYRMQSPYVLIGAFVKGSFSGINGKDTISLKIRTAPEGQWEKIREIKTTGSGRFNISLEDEIRALYGFDIMVDVNPSKGRVALADLRIELVFQANPGMLPRFRKGGNQMQFSASQVGEVKIKAAYSERFEGKQYLSTNAVNFWRHGTQYRDGLFLATPGQSFDVVVGNGTANTDYELQSSSKYIHCESNRARVSKKAGYGFYPLTLKSKKDTSLYLHPNWILVSGGGVALDARGMELENLQIGDSPHASHGKSIAPLNGEKGFARSVFHISEPGTYRLFAYKRGKHPSNGMVMVFVDQDTTGDEVSLEDYGMGVAYKETGLFWHWNRGRDYVLGKGTHSITVEIPAGEHLQLSSLVLLNLAPEGKGQGLEKQVNHFFLNRYYQPE
ncbi:hypothetical protein MNBD_BACTEROID01-447 [hydrothermal vent metagenome]|uniref:Transglutaminase-like domain-containing protein n=1 Tax=hydrothermal vent metagenome TaxID=652676 RepID=A0A3B0TVG2_9ZZZZ